MAQDRLDKGAILQRDKETYAIAPHIPGGIITDFGVLRKIADIAEKYGAKAVKLTSAERFAVIKDLGLVGMAKGWRVLAGGFASGIKPRLADVIATGLNDADALALVDRVIEWYRQTGKAKRLGRVIDEIGYAKFLDELGLQVAE